MEALRIQELKRKEEEDLNSYNPWGKPGAGAPLRDSRGAPIANLKTFQPVDYVSGCPCHLFSTGRKRRSRREREREREREKGI